MIRGVRRLNEINNTTRRERRVGTLGHLSDENVEINVPQELRIRSNSPSEQPIIPVQEQRELIEEQDH